MRSWAFVIWRIRQNSSFIRHTPETNRSDVFFLFLFLYTYFIQLLSDLPLSLLIILSQTCSYSANNHFSSLFSLPFIIIGIPPSLPECVFFLQRVLFHPFMSLQIFRHASSLDDTYITSLFPSVCLDSPREFSFKALHGSFSLRFIKCARIIYDLELRSLRHTSTILFYLYAFYIHYI